MRNRLQSAACLKREVPDAGHRVRNSWVAVKDLKLRDYPPIMENQMEKKMENEMETGGI